MASIDELTAEFQTYAAAVDAYVAAQTAMAKTIEEAVAAALAADEAGDTAAMATLRTAITDAKAKVPAPPVPPATVSASMRRR